MGRSLAWRQHGWETSDFCLAKWKFGHNFIPESHVSCSNSNSIYYFLLTYLRAYAPPPAATGDYSIQPITNGTYINGTHFIATFLCKGCILEDGTTFSSSDTSGYLGWALSSKASAMIFQELSYTDYEENRHPSITDIRPQRSFAIP